MVPLTSVLIHESRYPGRARAAYIESFRSRWMNHQFHYDTEKQSQLWLALHEAYSPARRDNDCLKTYQQAFKDVAAKITLRPLTVLSLGCGGGQKDQALLSAFSELNQITYVPTDVSLTLALTAHLGAPTKSMPAVLDLNETKDLSALITPNTASLICFFGMIPNFEPDKVIPQIAASLRSSEHLLMSANLAPGGNVEKILPQYDNELTRRWLSAVLVDAGLQLNPSDLEFEIGPQMRIEVGYRFQKEQTVQIDGEKFSYAPGEWFQLFFSYRHTPETVRDLFAQYGMQIQQQWIAASGEEGVFLLSKRQP